MRCHPPRHVATFKDKISKFAIVKQADALLEKKERELMTV